MVPQPSAVTPTTPSRCPNYAARAYRLERTGPGCLSCRRVFHRHIIVAVLTVTRYHIRLGKVISEVHPRKIIRSIRSHINRQRIPPTDVGERSTGIVASCRSGSVDLLWRRSDLGWSNPPTHPNISIRSGRSCLLFLSGKQRDCFTESMTPRSSPGSLRACVTF